MIWEDPDRLPSEGELRPLSPADLGVMREAYAALLHEPSDDARVIVDENTRTVRVEHAGITVSLYARRCARPTCCSTVRRLALSPLRFVRVIGK